MRLAALRDAPSAFGSSHAAEVERTVEFWDDQVERSAAGRSPGYWLAERDGETVGLVGAFRPPDLTDDRVDLVSMWVAPSGRRRGTGRVLVDAVINWSRDTDAVAVELWVTRGNEPAATLYRSHGFDVTGDVALLPSDPCKDGLRMRLELG